VTQTPILLRETLGDIAVLTLNRPEARNSLSERLIAELHEALKAIHDDAKVRAVVIAANGPAFSAGHDMKELTAHRTDTDRGRAYFAEIMNACSAMMQAIVALPKPVVAAVQAIATAAGCQLVASCDLAVASEAATFATPGVDIGLFCSTPMVALSRNVPRKQAMEMLLTGEPISANTAREIGLVNRVVTAGTERDAAIALAQKIALKSAYTVKIGKAAFYRQAEMSLADAYRYAAEVMTENMMARDAEEGIGAFFEKREPKWQDR
jgi:enoyl-CoA hydratase/carnithine racemase